MARRFKLRIARVFPSFQSCRSKEPSDLPENPVPSIFHFSPVNPKAVDIDFPVMSTVADRKPSKSHNSVLRRRVSSAFESIGCVFRSRSGGQNVTSSDYHDDTQSQEFEWMEEEDWHVASSVHEEAPRRKIYNSSAGESDGNSSPLAPAATGKKKIQRIKKKKSKLKVRTSTSSADSGWFSSEGGTEDNDDEESEALVSSSRSFSTDYSSDYSPHLETIRESPVNCLRRKKKKKSPKKLRKLKRCTTKCGKGVVPTAKTKTYSSPESELPARLSVFRRLMPCSVDGKVRESFAVVKKSDDPYEDFKHSMLEMILEKQMFEPSDLEQLLHCFLSLNSRHHHEVIVEAFSEIWETLFSKTIEEAARF